MGLGTPAPSTHHWPVLSGALAAVAVTVAVFAPTMDGAFVGDDPEELLGVVETGAQRTTEAHPGRNLRPVNQWLHARALDLFGIEPLGHHLLSLGLHLVAAATLVWAGSRVARAAGWLRYREVGVVAGLLFLVHPSHTEPVSWISSRGDLTLAIGTIVVLGAWFTEGTARPSARFAVLAVAGAALAFGSKEPAVTLPAVLTLVAAAIAPVGRRRSATLATWPLWATLVAYAVARQLALGTLKAGSWKDEFVGERPLRTLAGVASSTYRSFAGGLEFGGALGAGVLLIVAVAALRRPGGHRMLPVVGLLAGVVVSVLPVSHLAASPWNSGGERLVYTPSVLAVLAVAMTLATLPRRWALGGTVAVVAASVIALVPAQLRWSEAAGLSGSLSASSAEFPTDRPVVLLATPDVMRGVILRRNAEGHDLVLRYGWRSPAPVYAVATYEAANGGNRTRLRTSADGRRFELHLVDEGARFVEVEGPGALWQVPGVEARLVDERTVVVEVDDRLVLPRSPSLPGSEEAGIWWPDGGTWRRARP